jgi:hypothetical protein
MNLVAATAADSWMTPMHWALGTSTFGLLVLHFRNRGRSGPIAALLFVLVGPVLGVILMIAWLLGSRRDSTKTELYGLDVPVFFEVLLLAAVLAAFIGAAIHGYRIRDELRAYREFGPAGWLGRLKTGIGPSPALGALGLAPTATLEDVEQAYRELAKQTHPDRGGNVEQFKRLQVIYEQAKRQAGRGGRLREAAQEAQSPAAANDA